MSRIFLLVLATVALAAAQSERQMDTDPDPFVGTEEGLQRRPHRHGGSRDSHDDDDDDRHDHSDGDSRDGVDVSDEFDNNRPRIIRPPVFGPGSIPIQSNPGPILVQNPGPFPILPSAGPMIVEHPMPPMEPVLVAPPAPLPIEAQEGDGLLRADPSLPQILPQPEAQGGFRGPSSGRVPTTTTTTTTPPPPSTRPSGVFPSATLTCASVRCPSGAVCRMENNRRSREPEPVCAFLDSSRSVACSQLRCAAGFTCEMQQITPCPPRQPCPPNPVCVQNPVTTTPQPPPVVSCDSVRCGPGTLCRIQTVDNCRLAPCALQAVCISPCSTVNCPSNSQCKVEERTMATSCVPNAPSRNRSVCDGVRCGFGKRCNVVRNCHFTRECREEARCE